MSTRTCRLVTLGCKVNQYETQLVKEALEGHGYREAAEGESADLCVVNTCTVTNEGDAKSRKEIRKLAKHNPGTRTLVMGCYATRDPEAVAALPSVFEVVTDKRELPDILYRQGVVDMPRGISRFEGRKRAYVKVQDGCILNCTYCIIPKVRPGLSSRSPEDIEDEVRRLIDNGYKEIVISGIHVGHYGVDTTRGRSGKAPFRLWHLFRRLDRIPGDWRMRLSSIEANEVGDDFVKSAADCEHLCQQFHPALQSGSDSVLARMRRRYRVGKFLDKLDRIREIMPHVAFTTDVIVGFPGETEAEFEETLQTCRRAGFMKMHLFPFSARKTTPAADFADHISPEVRKERMQRLSVLERELALRYYQSKIGEELEVLVERSSTSRAVSSDSRQSHNRQKQSHNRQGENPDESGWVRGTDRYYIPVELPGTVDDIGQFRTVRGTQAFPEMLKAT